MKKPKKKKKVTYSIKLDKKEKYGNIFKSSTALLVFYLILSLNYLGLFAVGETVAYYYDIELSSGNFLGAHRLDFVVDSDHNQCEIWITYTQGGWGTKASGNNPGTYRDENFSAAFPSGA